MTEETPEEETPEEEAPESAGASPLEPHRRLSGRAARALWAVAERLRADAESIAEEIAGRVLAEVSGYERFHDDDARAAFVEAVRALVEFFPDLARVGRRLSGSELADVAAIGERRAREGVPFTALTAALNLGFDLARGQVFRAFWDLPRSDQDPLAIEALVAVLDAYKFDVVEGFREGFGRVDVEEQRDRNRARDAFLSEILLDESPDPEAVRAQAGALDARLSPPLEVVVVVDRRFGQPLPAGARDDDPFQSRANALARRLPLPVLGPVPIEHAAAAAAVRCVLVPDLTPPRATQTYEALGGACDDLDLLAVHTRAASLEGLHRATVRLLMASTVLDRLAPLVGSVTTPEALYGHRVVDGTTLVEQDHELSTVVAPLMARPTTAHDHVATLRVMLEQQFNMAATARELEVGADTVRRRLARISKLTGLSLRDRDTWRRIDLALCLLDLYADVLPPPGDPFWVDRENGPTLASLLLGHGEK